MKKNILFVAKDQALWTDFEEQSRSAEWEWSAQPARTGKEALALGLQFDFAAVVAEVDLPDMSGTDLLDEFMQRRPTTHRVILSDRANLDATLRCIGKSHHHLLKPLGIPTLVNVLNQACAQEIWLPSQAVQGVMAQMRTVPSPPATYFRVVDEIQSPGASLERIAALISEDPAITGKVMQLANSAVFGLELQVSQPMEAIAYIGLETTKALVLLAHTVSSFDHRSLHGFSVDALWRHSVCTGQLAQQIALVEKGGLEVAEQAFAGGLLHDIGKLLFCANLPGHFGKVLALARAEHCNFWEAEAQLFPGAGHAELGGCILGIWGLPRPITEAVALHHSPRRLGGQGFCALTAVHAANVLDHEMLPDASGIPPALLSAEYLNDLALTKRIDQWRRQGQNTKSRAHAA